MLKLITLNLANYDDHPGWLDRLGYIAQAIQNSGASVVCLTENRYNVNNAFNTYAPQYWSNHSIAAPDTPADMGAQIITLLNANQKGLVWNSFTALECTYTEGKIWESLSILSTLPLSNEGSVSIPHGTDGNTRIVQYADIKTQGNAKITVLNTHYPLDDTARIEASDQILELIVTKTGGSMFVLVGDLNATPSDACFDLFNAKGFVDIQAKLDPNGLNYTWATPALSERVDYIWSAPDLAKTVKSIAMVPANNQAQGNTLYLSDHLGLCATFII